MKLKVIRLVITAVVALAVHSSARADSFAYEVTGIGTEFGIVDLNTGVFTPVGNMGQTLAGLGTAGGVIYGVDYHGDTLYSVNTSTGALTTIGTGAVASGYSMFGSTTSGLYAAGFDGNLYTISPSTGAATPIGYIAIRIGPIVAEMSTGSSTLYVASDEFLYSLSTTTAAATLIGTVNPVEAGFGLWSWSMALSTVGHTAHPCLISTAWTRSPLKLRLLRRRRARRSRQEWRDFGGSRPSMKFRVP
jgi:hypothetical protein